jgi:hypothetical protein
MRVAAAGQLARNIARFGPLMTAEQEELLLGQSQRETNPAMRAAFSQVIGALRPKAAQVGERLRAFQPGVSAPGTTPPSPAPGPMNEPVEGEPEPIP